jgi:hypothetical protein
MSEPYGTSLVFPRVYGEHSHHFCFDKDPGVLQWQIDTLIKRGTECVRDNDITAATKYIGNTAAKRDELLEYYSGMYCEALLANGIIPFPVLLDRNFTGVWAGDGEPEELPAGLESAEDMFEIWTRARYITGGPPALDVTYDTCNRIALNLAIFGTDSGGICAAIRAFMLNEAQEIAEACPKGTWFQAFNGPETTHVCGQFGECRWDFTPDDMHAGSFTEPAANRAWALSALSITMPSTESAYLAKLEDFLEDMRERLAIAGHPGDRLVPGGIHSYVLDNGTVRSLGAPDPMDPTTIPENAVITEFGVPRYDDLPINDPDVRPRSLRQHASMLLAKQPRVMCLHGLCDSRRIDLWDVAPKRRTVNNWTVEGYTEWLETPMSPKPVLPYVAYPLLVDEPHLLEEIIETSERFRHYRHVLMP